MFNMKSVILSALGSMGFGGGFELGDISRHALSIKVGHASPRDPSSNRRKGGRTFTHKASGAAAIKRAAAKRRNVRARSAK